MAAAAIQTNLAYIDRRRLDETFRPDVFRHEIGMLAKSDDGRMVKKAVKAGASSRIENFRE
jgi:hypothetical protein